MKRLIAFTLTIALGLSFAFAPLSGAEELAESDEPVKTAVTEDSKEVTGADSEVVTEAVQQSTMLLQLKQKLAQAQYRYYLLQQNVENAKEGLENIREVIANLEATIENLEKQIKDSNKKILSVKSQKERKKMDLADLEEEVQILELQMEDQKELVAELMTLLYMKRGVYYDDEEVNAVKVLASPDSVSETLQKLTYLDLIEAENQDQIELMTEMSEELTGMWDELRQKREELDQLDEQLAGELLALEEEKRAQEELLEETKGEETIFETMLASADEHEEDLLREIQIYETNVEIMEEKVSSTRVLLSSDQQDLIVRIEEDMLANFDVSEAADFLELDWPVDPSRGITSYFIDSAYQERFGVQHYALDIRANHGSSIFAPADGVVYNVVFDDESTNYAYVMIAHRKGVMSVFGHVSDVAVSVGDYVTRGQIIGLTGGTPGSIGAGVRTTGPHLHFEIWQDGVRVDPLKYLPLEEVPLEYLPDNMLEEIQGNLEDQIKGIQEILGF